jgi:predicted GIY-YIG superfamily endonuclease
MPLYLQEYDQGTFVFFITLSVINVNSKSQRSIIMAIWTGHDFVVFQYNSTTWNNVAGIYIFAGANQQNAWVPVYIGQCDSFQNRIPSHEKWDKAQSLGATHVHAMVVSKQADRDVIEKALIQAYQPPLNIQHK